MTIFVLIAAGLVMVGVLVVFALKNSKKVTNPIEVNYRAFFILGVFFIPVGSMGVILFNVGFVGVLALGVVYLVLGLANRDKWRN